MVETIVGIDTESSIRLIFALIAIAGLTYIICSLKSLSRLPSSLAWADQRSEAFPRARACLRQLFIGMKSLDRGYAQVC